jgi:hypothetical protein
MYGRDVVVEVGPAMLDVTDLSWPGKETDWNALVAGVSENLSV